MKLPINGFLAILLLQSIVLTTAKAQDCSASVPSQAVQLGTMQVASGTLVDVSLTNTGTSILWIDSLVYKDAHLYRTLELEDIVGIPARIAPGSAFTTIMWMKIRHNVTIRGWIILYIHCECGNFIKSIAIEGEATAPDYQYTDKLEYSPLYDSLHAHVVNHTSLGYKAGREMMFGKADNVDDSVECIYTGKKLKTAGIPPNGEFNTEHSWVQSRGSSVEPNKSDVNHLYPTNPNANSIRANYPFGIVFKQWKDAGGGSRLGFTATNDTVFEPRDVSKGNIARSIFYYLVRYGNVTGYYTSPYNMDHDLRIWNLRDAPDSRERERCDTIAAYQGKRNPFVDHPEFVERLEFVNTPHVNVLHLFQRNIGVTSLSDSTRWELDLLNQSPDTVRLASIQVSDSDAMKVTMNSSDTLLPHSLSRLTLRYGPLKTPVPTRLVMTVIGSEGSRDSLVVGICAPVDVTEQINTSSTVRPQPMSDHVEVTLTSSDAPVQWLKLYSSRGELLADCTSQLFTQGNQQCCTIRRDQCAGERVLFLQAMIDGHVLSRTIVRE